MSRALIDPSILEAIPNQQVLSQIIVAPSMALKDAWEGGEEFRKFYQSIFNNLHEDNETEKAFLQSQASKALGVFYEQFNFQKKDRYHFRWNITDSDIRKELDR